MHAPAALHLEEAHSLDALLAIATFTLGAIGLVLVAAGVPLPGMWLGAVGVVAGLWGQMISRTTSERFLDVIGLVCAGLAFAIGAAQGDLSFSG